MYKKQMILQRVACFLLLFAAVIAFIYSLGFMTDLYDAFNVPSEELKETRTKYVRGSSMYRGDIQDFNRDLTTAGIILILSAVSLFVFQTHSRRKYYIANYIAVGVNAVINIGVCCWALPEVFKYKKQFVEGVDFEKLKYLSSMLPNSVRYIGPEDTFWFDISKVVFSIVIAATVVSIINLVLKVVLMVGEKKLVKAGKEGENNG